MKESLNPKTRIRNDILLILALLIICAIGATYLFVFREGGDTVRVTVNGDLFGVYSLAQDRTVDIQSADGSAYNRLVIRDGRAYMESASCPDGICVHHRAIYRNGESIVCRPNGVVVTTVLENDKEGPDIVA